MKRIKVTWSEIHEQTIEVRDLNEEPLLHCDVNIELPTYVSCNLESTEVLESSAGEDPMSAAKYQMENDEG